ncbi:MAG: repeat protein, partial [Solirubrobacterales bacterium]|nr:repeat protein [Solirubrobacterales bacterium]
TNPVNATLGDGVGVVTITNDDAAPTVSVSPLTILEGTGGTTTATLTVTLSAPSGRTILAGYATKDQTAIAGVDYQQAAELLTYNPGETSKTITIPIAPDSEIEQDETFEVYVFNAASGSDSVSPVTVTITDDDLNDANKPQLSVGDVTVALEGDAGTTRQAVFTVSMDRPLARIVTVAYATAPGSALAPDDYTAVAGVLTFAPGERTKTVTVTTVGDDLLEFNQDFRVQLAEPLNAKLLDGSGLGIITDDDAGGGLLTIGLQAAPKPLEKLKTRDLLCAKSTRLKRTECAGLRVGWKVAAAGRIDVTVTAIRPRGKARVARTFRVMKATRRLPKPGSRSSMRVKLAAGKQTELLVKRLRAQNVRLIRVTLTFTNQFGGRQGTEEQIRLLR